MSTFYKTYKRWYNKYIVNNDFIFFNLIRILSVIFYVYLKFVFLTSKIDYQINVDDPKKLKTNTTILAFWHGRLLAPLITRHYFDKGYVLISLSRGAYLIKLICRYFKVQIIEGSANRNGKDKGGRESIKKILNLLKQPNTCFAIAPDGSIGPRMRCSAGLASIALLSRLDVTPLAYSAKHIYVVNSWDKFIIPFPFNHITVKMDTPIAYMENGKRKESEQLRLEIENKLNKLTWGLDSKYKHSKISPTNVGRKGVTVKIKHKNYDDLYNN